MQCDLVSVEHKAIRDHLLQVSRTALNVEDTVAFNAMEVMVVFCRDFGEFVPIRLARDGDTRHQLLIFQPVHHAIDRANSQRRHRSPCAFVDLFDREWATLFGEQLPNRIELACVPALGHVATAATMPPRSSARRDDKRFRMMPATPAMMMPARRSGRLIVAPATVADAHSVQIEATSLGQQGFTTKHS